MTPPSRAGRDQLLARQTRTYAFEFADRTAPALFETPPGFPLVAAHAHELAYLFELLGHHLLQTPAQEQLADQMIGTGQLRPHRDPNGRALPHWQPVRAGHHEPYVQSLESGPSFPGPVDLTARHCDLWRTIPQT